MQVQVCLMAGDLVLAGLKVLGTSSCHSYAAYHGGFRRAE